MSGAHEALEHAEHAAHGGGHGEGHGGGGGHHAPPSKLIGLTMGLMGVLIAFCAAMVGSERNELTKTMIDQTQAHSDFTAASTKFRLVMMELEKLRTSPAAKPGADLNSPEVKPYRTVLERFLHVYLDYSGERKITKAWADSYAPVIKAHFEAAEGFERGQLIAEIGIVLSSLAVLLASRPAWLLSVALGLLCIGQLGKTYVVTHKEVGEAEGKVEEEKEHYTELRKAHTGANEDELTVEALDPGSVIRDKFKKTEEGEGHEGHGAKGEKGEKHEGAAKQEGGEKHEAEAKHEAAGEKHQTAEKPEAAAKPETPEKTETESKEEKK